ncbi:MAG: DUF4091 domain-containing protein [Christensenellales bacterium]|jgi:hypothetical protein
MKVDLRLVSPLEKVFLDEPPRGGYLRASALRGETASFQAAWIAQVGNFRGYVELRVHADVPVRLRRVRAVPVAFPAIPDADGDYLRKTPGLYPDLLEDTDGRRLRVYAFRWESCWIDIEGAPAGDHEIAVALCDEAGIELAREVFHLHIIAADLPAQTLIHTKWFHCDGICEYYGLEMWSEEFWRVCEAFIRLMPKRGINMLLTPIHTPPLDTRVGGERMTCQLVDVYAGNAGYSFGFEKLHRWVEMAQRCGIEYFEMAHLFTQWGAKFAPKIVADVCGETKRIFGWDTEATGTLYRDFLRAYLPALTAELKRMGIAERVYFHISDEPSAEMIDDYRAARDLAMPYLEGFPVMDALSSFEFYKTGAVAKPIPANNHIAPFLEAGVEGLWTYYCVGQYKDVSNMFMAMPSYRNRILAQQLYKFGIEGFLQWGYNFYHAQFADYPIDPFLITDGDGFAPAGDAFQVYPGAGGVPLESIRMMVTAQAMEDLRAFQLLEQLRGRAFVMAILEDGVAPITFEQYPRSADYIHRTRECVNREIERAL